MKNKLLDKVLVVVILIASILMPVISYSEDNNDYQVKRVVSIVLDDSKSMLTNGQDYYYANYTLQNLIGMMNDTDEMNVVYLSEVDKNNKYEMKDADKRKKYIDNLKHYNKKTDTTNFVAVDTAAEYLKSKKSLYGSDNSYRYYLVVITDGNFENYPDNFTKYLGDLRDNFIGSYFKGIFIGIGDNISSNLKSSVLANQDYHYISSNGKEDIVNAVFTAHDLIYNREIIDEKYLNYGSNNNTISFDAKENVNRVIVLEQNQNAKVKNIEASNGNIDDQIYFECEKTNSPRINSVIVHGKSNLGPLKKGNININFDKPVDKSNNNMRVMVEYTGAEAKDKIITPTQPITPTSPPTQPTTPTPPILPPNPNIEMPNYIFPIFPFILLALLLGYFFKNRLDTKTHGIEKWSGKKRINDSSIIKVHGGSKFVPYAAESGMGADLQIKATNKKDKVIVPQKFLTSDMKLEGESINTERDLTLYENMKLTKLEDGKEITYIYKYYPNEEVDV